MSERESATVRMAINAVRTLLEQPESPARRHAVSQFIASMPRDAVRAVCLRVPEMLGGLSGVPLELRLTANAELLRRALLRSLAERSAVDQEIERRQTRMRTASDSKGVRADREVRRLGARYAQRARLGFRIENLSKLLEPRSVDSGSEFPRQYLRVDLGWQADRGVVEILGDIAHADAVAVIVPGIRQNVDAHRITRAKAERLLRACATVAPEQRVAVIAWSGYATPNSWVRGAISTAARAGAPQLAEDLETITAVTTAPITVIGHCYGARLAMHAARHGAPIANLIAVGHLGMDVPTTRALSDQTQLRAYSLVARGDRVKLLSVLGRDPWVQVLRARRLDPGTEISGHLDYWRADSVSLINQALVVTGNPQRALYLDRRAAHHAIETPPHQTFESRILERGSGPQL
ncbi:MAG: alpha/beta hydrolase [Acidimicrobiia bacterium]